MSLIKTGHPDFIVVQGYLSLRSVAIFVGAPEALFSLFEVADRLGLDLHPDALAAVARHIDLVTPALQSDPDVARIFLSILTRGRTPSRTLFLMCEAGLLRRYIPELYDTQIADRILRAIGIVHDIQTGRATQAHPLATSIMQGLVHKDNLYLATLLLGADTSGHTVETVCGRLGIAGESAEEVKWLVHNHGLLGHYAQMRDISDASTVAAFADIVKTPERLNLLAVMTVADLRASGPDIWNAWKGHLMRDLVTATLIVLRGDRSQGVLTQVQEVLKTRADQRRGELSEDNAGMAAWLETMDESYLFSFTPTEIRQHAALVWSAFGCDPFVNAHIDTARNATAFCISSPDRFSLFADLAQAFSNLGGNVVGAKVFRSKDGDALDVFYVQDDQGMPFAHDDPARRQKAAVYIERVAGGQLPERRQALPKACRAVTMPSVVSFDDSSANFTIIDLSGQDRQGLLADLVCAITKSGLDIAAAHIDCYGEQAVDAFYVVDHFTKRPLSTAQKQTIGARLLSVLEGVGLVSTEAVTDFEIKIAI